MTMVAQSERMTMTRHTDPPELIMERIFDAWRALVWRAYTEPERVARWWAPTGWTTPVCTMDVRPGGVWHYCFRGPNGEEAWGKATYLEIVKPERIVYTDGFSDAEGNLNEQLPTSQVTVAFTERDGATTITCRIRFASVADLDTTLAMGMVEGFGQTWDHLAAELAA